MADRRARTDRQIGAAQALRRSGSTVAAVAETCGTSMTWVVTHTSERRKSRGDLEAENEHLRHCLHELTVPPALVPAGVFSKYEERVLGALMARPGLTLSRDQILVALYYDRPDHYPDDKIIDVFICKVRRKMAATGVPGAIQREFARGYRYVPVGA